MSGVKRSMRVRVAGAPLSAMGAIALLATGPLSGQEPTARAYLEPAEVGVGDPFELVVEVTGAIEVGNLVDRTLSFRRCRDPSARPPDRTLPFSTEIRSPSAGQAGGSVAFSCSSVAETAGSFVFGPFTVTADGRKLETEAVTLVVTVPDPNAVSVRARLDRGEVELGEEFELIVDVTPPDVEPGWPELPDIGDFATGNGLHRRDGSMVFRFTASAPGTHEIGPAVFEVGNRTLRTEPVRLVVVGDAPALEAHAYVNTAQTWVGSDFALVVEVFGASEMDADPVLPDMSGFAEPPRERSRGRTSGQGRPTADRKYQVRALTAGEFEIGPVQVKAGGRTVLTEPLRLVISEAPPPAPVESPKDLRATAAAEQHRVYVTEPVIVTYRVLARDNRTGFEGWSVEKDDTLVLPPHDNFQHRRMRSRGGLWERVSLDGRLYRVASEHRVLFSPVEAGETAIKSAELMVQVNQRGRWGDWEMNRAEREGTWTRMTLTTDPIPIEVVPLPAEGRPASFRGHVGRLKMASWIDRTNMRVGDTVTLRVEVSGLSLLAPDPEIAFPAVFGVSDLEIGSVDRGDGDMRETRRYVLRLVAKQEGSHRLRGVEVSWFDPESGSYGTSSTEPFGVTVAGAAREGG